jgi:hypothetical protein
MGFLSKFFGGDAGTSPAKVDPSEPPRSSATQPESAVAVREPQLPPPRQQLPTVPIVKTAPAKQQPPAEATPAQVAPAASPPAPPAAPTAPAPQAEGAKLEGAKLDSPPPTGEKAAPATPGKDRRALEDSVVTSAPKLFDGAARGPAAPRPMVGKAAGRPPASTVTSPRSAAERQAFEPAVAEKSAEKTAPVPLGPANALRSRRDHSKSPGFYSAVGPALGADAVATSPLVGHGKKSSAAGIAPPQVEPRPVEARGAVAPADAAAAPPASVVQATLGSAGAAASVVAAATDVPQGSFAPPQPHSAPPASVAVARVEKEETSPGLGYSRSRHDPSAALQLSEKDLELLSEFALDLGLGGTSDAWLAVLRPVVQRLTLAASSASTPYPMLDKALGALTEELIKTERLDEQSRPRLYGQLVALDLALAKRLDVVAQKALRERLIVDQLLEEIALSQPVVTRRLREQGLASLEGLQRIGAVDLAQKLDCPLEQAEQIINIFQGYAAERAQRGPSGALGGKSLAMRQRLAALEASADAFERASEGEDSGERRRTRRQRQIDAAQLGLLLAELGEAKVLAELERCSVQAKIQRIQRWLAERPSAVPLAPPASARS